ncbi:MAG TPA: glycogen synthase GlgA [Clostridiales bacterium]|nr:glycogen synthase GlgA [Clostridiales bacterium]
MAASEGAPFIKTGGLGEVIGSLPKALREENIDVRVVLPKYMAIPAEYRDDIQYLKYIYVDVGWRHQYCGIEKYILDGLPVYFIDNEYYFGRDMIYGYDDDEPERYAFYCRAVLEILPHIDFMPDIIHCHDWQTGMIPVFLKANYMQDEFYRGIGTIFTIHNLKYQGIFSKDIMKELLGLDEEYYTSDKLEFYGGVSFMKGGLTYSDIISTVSPTYAQEIQTPFLGQKLDGLLRARRSELFGILNGIDYDVYNPAEDPLIYANYDSRDLRGKLEGKLKLQKRLGLPVREDVPIIAIITRLVSQKGLDLIESVLEEILAMDIQMIVMGDGEPHYEWLFRDGSHRYPHKLSANIYYENELAHKIYAGADMFLMPSLFEPCGLAQLFSLRYGTIPIVRETGGLKDTVQSYNEFTGEGNGFSFTDYNAHDMLYTIRRAIEYYYKEDIWDMLIRRGMTGDYSWKRSASKYIELYNMLKYHR